MLNKLGWCLWAGDWSGSLKGMMKTKKKLECSTGVWSQVFSQGVKPKPRCPGNLNRCINKTMGMKEC